MARIQLSKQLVPSNCVQIPARATGPSNSLPKKDDPYSSSKSERRYPKP